MATSKPITVPIQIHMENCEEIAKQMKRVGQAWIELGFTYERLAELAHNPKVFLEEEQ